MSSKSHSHSQSTHRLTTMTTKPPNNRRLIAVSNEPWGHDHPEFGVRKGQPNEIQAKSSATKGNEKVDKLSQRKRKAKAAKTAHSTAPDNESLVPHSTATKESSRSPKSSYYETYRQSKFKSYLQYLERPISPGLDYFSNEVVQRKSKYYLSNDVNVGAPAPRVNRQVGVGGSLSASVVPKQLHGQLKPFSHEAA